MFLTLNRITIIQDLFKKDLQNKHLFTTFAKFSSQAFLNLINLFTKLLTTSISITQYNRYRIKRISPKVT